jgi:2',3'-cyclic-nucleotide 2'-phosphodiesterase (5'-nucleotidase family)
LTEQNDIYPPNAKPKFRSVNKAIIDIWNQAKRESNGSIPDLFLPLTHQLVQQDRDTCTRVIAKHSELASRTPILLGGHDHEVYIEEAGKSMIVKVGLDVEHIGVVDIWFTSKGEIKRRISLLPSDEFDPNPAGLSYAEETMAELDRFFSTPLAVIPGGTTKKVRFEESVVASWLLSTLKRGLSALTPTSPVDVVFMQAGAIRGKADYEDRHVFTMGDLYNEFAFENPMGIVHVPGSVIAESVRLTRLAPKPAPQFMHLDMDCTVISADESADGQHTLTHINRQPIIPDKIYKVATWNNTLNGVNDIQPFLSYVEGNESAVESDCCAFAKNVALRILLTDAWGSLLSLDQQKRRTANASVSCEYHREVDVLAAVDSDNNNRISIDELSYFVEKQGHDVYHGRGLHKEMMRMFDFDEDGGLSQDEVYKLVQGFATQP